MTSARPAWTPVTARRGAAVRALMARGAAPRSLPGEQDMAEITHPRRSPAGAAGYRAQMAGKWPVQCPGAWLGGARAWRCARPPAQAQRHEVQVTVSRPIQDRRSRLWNACRRRTGAPSVWWRARAAVLMACACPPPPAARSPAAGLPAAPVACGTWPVPLADLARVIGRALPGRSGRATASRSRPYGMGTAPSWESCRAWPWRLPGAQDTARASSRHAWARSGRPCWWCSRLRQCSTQLRARGLPPP
jgi:hypothetical protein